MQCSDVCFCTASSAVIWYAHTRSSHTRCVAENHKAIFERCGLEYRSYRYFRPEDRGLDLEGMIEDLKAAPDGATITLHACAHNPTGVDPTPEQWRDLASVCKAKNFFIIFDSAYLGFASGSPDADAEGIRIFIAAGIPMFVTMSYSKNFGLYNERIGE